MLVHYSTVYLLVLSTLEKAGVVVGLCRVAGLATACGVEATAACSAAYLVSGLPDKK